ncbi:MAG: DUF5615 family PIN-like protein [Sphingomonas fennica]
MRFLLDVHVSTAVSRFLTDAGHDVLRAALVLPTAPDLELLAVARAEDRIIVSADSDFSDLIFAWGELPPPAMIYLRCPPADQPGVITALLDGLTDISLDGHMVVLSARGTRVRPFPRKS